MTVFHRLALLCAGLIGCWTLLPFPQGSDVHARPLPLLVVQYPFSTPEPPLAGGQVRPLVGSGGPIGTPYPVDPPAPVVTLRVRVTAQSAPKKEIEYKICVQNTSPAAAHHVLVRNPLPTNTQIVRAKPEPTKQDQELQWHFGTLQPGACREIVLVLLPTNDEDVKNCARVQFEHGQCVTTRIGSTAPPPPSAPIGTAKLTVALNGPAQQYANLPAKYQITVRNESTVLASNVVLSNLLPPPAKFVSASHGGQLHMQQVAWQLGTVPAGGSRTVQFVMRAEAGGDLVNRTTVLWFLDQRAEATLSTRFIGTSALHLDLEDTKDPIAVGGKTTYLIKVKNDGSAAVTNLLIQVSVPPELKVTRAQGHDAESAPPKDLPKPTETGQQPLAFGVIKELPAGKEARFEVEVQAVRAGEALFRVRMTADQLKGGPVDQEENTTIVKN